MVRVRDIKLIIVSGSSQIELIDGETDHICTSPHSSSSFASTPSPPLSSSSLHHPPLLHGQRNPKGDTITLASLSTPSMTSTSSNPLFLKQTIHVSSRLESLTITGHETDLILVWLDV